MVCWRTVRRIFRLRKIIWLVAVGAFFIAALLLSYRWWLPSVLPVAARTFGLEVGSVTWQAESSNFRLERLSYFGEGTVLSIDWLELPNVGTYFKTRGDLAVGIVNVSVNSVSEAETSSEGYGPMDLQADLDEALGLLDSWLPATTVERVTVAELEGSIWLKLKGVEYAASRLRAQVLIGEDAEWLTVSAELPVGGVWTAQMDAAEIGLGVTASLGLPDEGGLPIFAEVSRGAYRLQAEAILGAESWLPVSASMQSAGFVVDVVRLPEGLSENFESLQLDRIDLNWDGSGFAGGLTLGGVYANAPTAGEAFTASAQLSGDLEHVQVDALSVAARWLEVDLSEPIRWDWADGVFSGDALLRASVDLSAQNYFDAAGSLEAQLRVSEAALREVQFELSGASLRYGAYAFASFSASGQWSGDRVELSQLRLVPEAGGEGLTLSGNYSLTDGALDFDYDLALKADWLNSVLAADYFVKGLSTSGRLGGSLEAPKLSAALETEVKAPQTEVIELKGDFEFAEDFEVEGRYQLGWHGVVQSKGAAIQAALTATLGKNKIRVETRELVWTDPDRPELSLAKPFVVEWDLQEASEVSWEDRLQVEAFALLGTDLQLSGHYRPVRLADSEHPAGLRLIAENLSMLRLNRWLVDDLPEYKIANVRVLMRAFRPYLLGALSVHVEEPLPEGDDGDVVRLEMRAELEESGLRLESLDFSLAGTQLLQGRATLPLSLGPEVGSDGGYWRLLGDAPIEGQITGAVTPEFSQWLSSTYQVQVEAGRIEMNAAGTLAQPEGQLILELSELSLAESMFEQVLPAIRELRLQAEAGKEVIRIEPLSFRLRQASLRGGLTLPSAAFAEWVSGDFKDWQAVLKTAEGSVELSGWSMEDWTDWMPALLRRTGTVEGQLTLAADLGLSGVMRFKGFALRPSGTLPSVNQIEGLLELDQRRLRLLDSSASVGGYPVRFEGFVDAENWNTPDWRFDIFGENVQLVRTSEMMLRSDLDLTARSRDAEQLTPIVEGSLNLRSSTLLVEIDPFAPKYEGGAVKKPPYFSIPDAPFADWRFDLKLKGDRFMRVRSPYFRALLSADFTLGGSFEYPELVGNLSTNDTEVKFPGASMKLEEGEAYITAAQPDALQLSFKGVAQKAGYVVSMEVSETLSNPYVQFQATPELSNAEIIRLLATGSLSGGGLGAAGLYLGQGLLGNASYNESWTDRISIDYGNELSREGRNTLGVRYEINEDLYLNGEYDRYDAYNLDLGWRIFER